MSALLRRSRPTFKQPSLDELRAHRRRARRRLFVRDWVFGDSSTESGSEDGDGEDTGHHAGLAEIRAILQQRYESSDVDKGKDRDEDSGDDDGSTSSVDSFSSNDESESQSSADEDNGHHAGLAAIRAYLQYEYK